MWFLKALDKIRFESLTDKSKLDGQPELFIRLVPDKANNTLSIIDSGIGMTKAGNLMIPFCFRRLMHVWIGDEFDEFKMVPWISWTFEVYISLKLW